MKSTLSIFFFCFFTCWIHAQNLRLQRLETNTASSLRGISAVSDVVCWASGSDGTVIRTIDGGINWENVSPDLAYWDLQFRDIEALNKNTALILSAGLPAVILLTENGGRSWIEVYRNEKEGIFFDAMDFWNAEDGMAFSDAVKNKILIIKTTDGGRSWQEIDSTVIPDVHPQQGGFAASGTCLYTFADSSVIIGLGGVEASILLSEDYGESWIKTKAPLDEGEASKGIFSFTSMNADSLICVGGDYRGDSLSENTIALSIDGGMSWNKFSHPTLVDGKYRSSIAYSHLHKMLICCSRTGINYSTDHGKNWKELQGSFYSVSVSKEGAAWFSGPEGSMGKIIFE